MGEGKTLLESGTVLSTHVKGKILVILENFLRRGSRSEIIGVTAGTATVSTGLSDGAAGAG